MSLKTFNLFLIALLLVILNLACAASEESSGSGSALTALLPDDTSRLEVMAVSEILGGAVPEVFTEEFEETWGNYVLGDDLLAIEDVDKLVQVLTNDGEITMMSGSRLDFTGISEWLADEEANVEKTTYRGEEMWGNDILTMVILETDGYIAMGDTEAIKALLRVKARGTGSLAQASDSAMKKAYDDAAPGWYLRTSETCEEFSETLRSCEAYSVTASQGEEDFRVQVDYRFLFRSEQRAESQALDIEDLLDDMDWDADLEEVRADDTAVEAKVTGDEEDFDFEWVIYVLKRVPHILPTAVPEPTAPTVAPPARLATRAPAATRDSAPTVAPPARLATRAPAATRDSAPTVAPPARLATRAPAATARIATPRGATLTPTPIAAGRATTEELDPCFSKITSTGTVRGRWDLDCFVDFSSSRTDLPLAQYYTFSIDRLSIVEILLHPVRANQGFYLLEGEGKRGPVVGRDDNSLMLVELTRGNYTIEVVGNSTESFTLSIALPYE